MSLKERWEYLREAMLPRIWPGPAGEILYVVDRAAWSFYWDGYYITQGVRQGFGQRARLTCEPWAYKNKIIHFGARYAYIHGPHLRLSDSNRLLLTWFHGEPWDPAPAVQKLFSDFSKVEARLEKIVVSNTTCQRGLEEFGISPQRLVNIPLGVDLNQFKPVDQAEKAALRKSLGIPPEAFCIGSFQKDGTGWGEGNEPKLIKGPDIFLEVVARLAQKQPNLWVVLTGPSRGYVKKGLEKIGVGYTHRFLDDYLEIVRFYQCLDLYPHHLAQRGRAQGADGGLGLRSAPGLHPGGHARRPDPARPKRHAGRCGGCGGAEPGRFGTDGRPGGPPQDQGPGPGRCAAV